MTGKGLEFHFGGIFHDAHHQLHQFFRHGGGIESLVEGLYVDPSLNQTVDLNKHFDHGPTCPIGVHGLPIYLHGGGT